MGGKSGTGSLASDEQRQPVAMPRCPRPMVVSHRAIEDATGSADALDVLDMSVAAIHAVDMGTRLDGGCLSGIVVAGDALEG